MCIVFIGVVVFFFIVVLIVGVFVWEFVEEGNVKVVKKWGVIIGIVFEFGVYFVNFVL